MFDKNRIMLLHDEEIILVHFNGREVSTIYESWDSLDAFRIVTDLFNKLGPECRQKDFHFVVISKDEIDIDVDNEELLYEVRQFTQEEEKAFFTADWKRLNELLTQRAEDGNIE